MLLRIQLMFKLYFHLVLLMFERYLYCEFNMYFTICCLKCIFYVFVLSCLSFPCKWASLKKNFCHCFRQWSMSYFIHHRASNCCPAHSQRNHHYYMPNHKPKHNPLCTLRTPLKIQIMWLCVHVSHGGNSTSTHTPPPVNKSAQFYSNCYYN